MIPGMDPGFAQIIRVCCIVAFVIAVIYVLFGLLSGGHAPALR